MKPIDYSKIAKIINHELAGDIPETTYFLSLDLADYFQEIDYNFPRQKFIKECGGYIEND